MTRGQKVYPGSGRCWNPPKSTMRTVIGVAQPLLEKSEAGLIPLPKPPHLVAVLGAGR